jgi:hypothetical protein
MSSASSACPSAASRSSTLLYHSRNSTCQQAETSNAAWLSYLGRVTTEFSNLGWPTFQALSFGRKLSFHPGQKYWSPSRNQAGFSQVSNNLTFYISVYTYRWEIHNQAHIGHELDVKSVQHVIERQIYGVDE